MPIHTIISDSGILAALQRWLAVSTAITIATRKKLSRLHRRRRSKLKVGNGLDKEVRWPGDYAPNKEA